MLIFAFCQDNYDGCGTQILSNESPNPSTFIGGKYKPERSNIGNPSSANDYFPILIVFVQFQGEPYLVSSNINAWPSMQAPNYINRVISNSRISSSEWWNSYNGYDISDYWHEFSRGKLHVRGRVESVILNESIQWYENNGGMEKVNRDVYDILVTRLLSDWPIFDHWNTIRTVTSVPNLMGEWI
ncbi:MAG: hypothetical protein ABIY50_08505 [Ignavibacteria bacterium]